MVDVTLADLAAAEVVARTGVGRGMRRSGATSPTSRCAPGPWSVHHTHTPNDLDPGAAMRALQRLHVVDRAWNDVGYHLAVGPDGEVFVGRRTDDPWGTSGAMVVGAHAFGGEPRLGRRGRAG